MRTKIWLLLWALPLWSHAATSVTQHTITWTFNADYTVGQYANGDYYVVAPSGLTITGISPASTLISGRTMHGSMVNPDAGTFVPNGLDSGLGNFNAAYNRGRPGGADISAGNPLVVAAGSTVVSVRSHAAAGNRPQFTDGAYLTVVASAPAAGSFRPSPSNPDKTPPANISDLDYSILGNYTTVTGAPALATMEAAFARPWFEIELSNQGREWHPLNNQPMYGRDMANLLGDGLLTLHVNRTDAAKETLYIRMVQYGLDIYGAAKHTADTDTYPGWWANGGFNLGRKAPMLLAGLALGDSAIIAEANGVNYPIFQEDQGTFYVGAGDVGRVVKDDYVNGSVHDRQRLSFTAGYVGLPDWRVEGNDLNKGSNLNSIYRDVNNPGFLSHGLAMMLTTGAATAWNHPPFFDYVDRIARIGDVDTSTFALNMWSAYRSNGPTPWTAPAPVFGPGFIPAEGTLLVLTLSDAVQIGAGGAPTVTLSASGGAVTATYDPSATAASMDNPSTGNGYGSLSSNLRYSFSRIIVAGETVTFSCTNGANQIESVTGGLDATSITGAPVVNYTAAVLQSATILSGGTQAEFVFDSPIYTGSGISTGSTVWTWSLSGGAVTSTYASGSGTNTVRFNMGRTIGGAETGTVIANVVKDTLQTLVGADMIPVSTAITNNAGGGGDTTPPTPNPATISGTPTKTATTITVVASTASDAALGSVPYEFSSNNGSSWTSGQSSATYQFTGLTASTVYQVRVRYRDAAGNVGTQSAATAVTTDASADTTAPSPNPATLVSVVADSTTQITVTATTATDAGGLHAEPYGHAINGGWWDYQSSPVRVFTGLTPGTSYNFKTRTRDAAGNVTTQSDTITVSTLSVPTSYPPTRARRSPIHFSIE